MKKYAVLFLVMVLAVTMLAGCRRGRVDNTSEATTTPTTGMTMPTITEDTMPRNTTPNTTRPDMTEGMNGNDGTNGNGITGGTEGNGGTGMTEDTSLPQARSRGQRPY